MDNYNLLAKDIFMHYIFVIDSNKYRICDIEFYPDNESQKNIESYSFFTNKNGFYINIIDNHKYINILIRSILDIENDKLIEGPQNILKLVNGKDFGPIYNEEKQIYLSKYNHKNKCEMRKGVRTGTSADNNNYRYAIMCDRLKNKIYKQAEIKTTKESFWDNMKLPDSITEEDEIEILKKIWISEKRMRDIDNTDKQKSYFKERLDKLKQIANNDKLPLISDCSLCKDSYWSFGLSNHKCN